MSIVVVWQWIHEEGLGNRLGTVWQYFNRRNPDQPVLDGHSTYSTLCGRDMAG